MICSFGSSVSRSVAHVSNPTFIIYRRVCFYNDRASFRNSLNSPSLCLPILSRVAPISPIIFQLPFHLDGFIVPIIGAPCRKEANSQLNFQRLILFFPLRQSTSPGLNVSFFLLARKSVEFESVLLFRPVDVRKIGGARML